MKKLVEFLLTYLYCFSQILDGLIGIITFTKIKTYFTLKTAKNLAKWRRLNE